MEKTLEEKVARLEAMIMQVNEASVRTDIRLSVYMGFLINRNVFSIGELESVKKMVDAEIERLKEGAEE